MTSSVQPMYTVFRYLQYQIKTVLVKSNILAQDHNGIMHIIHTCTVLTPFAGFRLHHRLP